MSNSSQTKTIMIIASILLASCGSGGQSNTPNNTNDNNTAANSSEINISNAPSTAIKTEDLVAQENFNFSTKRKVAIAVDLGTQQAQGTRYQVNFYTHYNISENTYTPHFKTQFTSGTVINGQFNQTVQLNKNTTKVLAELWTYDGEAPTQAIINIEDDSIVWQL